MANIALLVPCEVQEPHPQPPPRKRRGGYDLPCMIRKRYKVSLSCLLLQNRQMII